MQTNNKLREALETARLFVTNCNTPLTTPLEGCGMSRAEVMNIIDTALAEPVKNNEVGTAEKQAARHHAWCRRHGINGDKKVDCAHPDMSCDLCTLRWAQKPYDEGGAK